jgi:L-ascorbate metabolism protein UlaG (beta-lactamase superfamily)
MKERERPNPIIPTEDEKRAVALANQFKDFISKIRSVTSKTSRSSLNKISDAYNKLREDALTMIDKINNLAYEQGLTEITSYYFLYLLQQVSRFNSLFQECTIVADSRDNPKTRITSHWAGYKTLKDKGIEGINHTLLDQPANLRMEVAIRSAKIFREAYEYNDDGKRFYYHEKTTPHNTAHQDRIHYKNVNPQIAAKTQASNLRGFFKTNTGQAHDNYFKHGSRDEHEREQRLFRSAIKNIHGAVALTPEQLEVLQIGKFYRYHSPTKFRPKRDLSLGPNQCNYQITHIGHAAELLAIDSQIPLHLVIDPIHYQSGTGGLIGLGGKLLYDRKTDPAFGTHDYPSINLVLISHNHYDHLCERSLTEAFGQSNTLFIVPRGDAELLHKKFGMTNVIEMDWNDVVQITLQDGDRNSSTYEIRGFPANHASNRSMSDYFKSLYMGYMVKDSSNNKVILFTGDTGKLEEQHYIDLAAYLRTNDLTISTACIAHGPDRPRSLMECTHQSSADALTMHSKFNVINALQYANRISRNLSWEDICQSACHAIGYHQGCYRLGLLNIHDVDTTLLRTLSVLTSFGDVKIDKITKEQLNSNLFYNFMDNFEQEALQNTLTEYRKLTVNDKKLTAQQVFTLITSHLTIPLVGARNDFGDHTKLVGFEFDYSRLILNRNPSQNQFNKNIGFNAAYEYFAYHFNLELIENNYFNPLVLTQHILNLYLDRTRISVHKENKSKPIKEFLNTLPYIDSEQLPLALGKLYLSLFPKQDEGLRDEGHTCTAFLILAGLIYDQGNFRQQFKERCVEVQNSIPISEREASEESVATRP